jgi:hypothetical protein
MTHDPRRNVTPCANLIEATQQGGPPHCQLGLRFPVDCVGCASYAPGLTEQERTRCEVWTRVMGYHRPVSAFNAGKHAEHAERKQFTEQWPQGQEPTQ